MLFSALEEAFLAGGQVIPARDRGTVGEETVGEIGANETGDAGDEDVIERHEKNGTLNEQRFWARLQSEADAEIAEYEGHAEREEITGFYREIRIKLGEDLMREIDVFAADEFSIRNIEVLFPNPIS